MADKLISYLICCKGTEETYMTLTMKDSEEEIKNGQTSRDIKLLEREYKAGNNEQEQEKRANERDQEADEKGQPLTGETVGLLDMESNGDRPQHCKKQQKMLTEFLTTFLEIIQDEENEDELELVLESRPKSTDKSAEAPNTVDDEVDPKAGQDKEANNEVKEEAEEKDLDVVIHATANGQAEVSLQSENKESEEAARSLASQLYNLTGFKRSEVAQHLSQNTDFGKMVAKEYLTFFDFTGMRLDVALRLFLQAFLLEGATKKQERILTHFSERYHQCNPTAVALKDVVHCLTCAMMLLNADLHGHYSSMKMSCKEFLRNLRRVNDDLVFPEKLAKKLYHSIRKKKLECGKDDGETLVPGKTDTSLPTHFCRSSAQQLANAYDRITTVHKTGYLIRKRLTDKNGKRIRKGQRAWKPFYAILKGMVLFLQKKPYNPEKGLSEAYWKNAISLHNATAFLAEDYRKRPNVLCLKTANMRQFYFQAESEQELMSWVSVINDTIAGNSGSSSQPTALFPEQLKADEVQRQNFLSTHLKFQKYMRLSYYSDVEFKKKMKICHTSYSDLLNELALQDHDGEGCSSST